jgi:tartrate dehydratase alpha subunit/fumarate hydratase class I-like protein
MINLSNLFVATVSEYEGTGCPEFLYASGHGVGISKSPREATEMAKRRASAALDARWEEQGNPYGGCPVLSEITLRKGGKLISHQI